MRKFLLAIPALALLAGCGTGTNGTKRMVSVNTDNQLPAQCLLTNGNGAWSIRNTPDAVLITGSLKKLVVTCSAPGGWHGQKVLSPKINPNTIGNLLDGGPIGEAVDLDNGGATKYSPSITVHMTR